MRCFSVFYLSNLCAISSIFKIMLFIVLFYHRISFLISCRTRIEGGRKRSYMIIG